MTDYLTTTEVADRLKVTQDTVSSYCKRGLLPGAVRVTEKSPWRIPEDAFESLVPERRGLDALVPDPGVLLAPRNARSAAQQRRGHAA